jgi:hypothetical protein
MRSSRAVAVVVGLLLTLAAGAQAPDPVQRVFRTQVELEKKLLAGHLSELERINGELRAAGDRLVRLSEDLVRAEREGEDLVGLAARSLDLRRAEAEVAQLIAAGREARTAVATRRSSIALIEAEIARLEEELPRTRDDISGRWNVVLDPGSIRGVFDLRLDGTLVNGVYNLSGGWKGSLRGTYVDGILRLERIDSELGFVAVLRGRVAGAGGERRLAGAWQATNLAAGQPASGSWVARPESQ